MTVSIALDATAPEPAYEQVRRQIAGHIATGALRLGDRLPTIAALAADLGIAGNTVARAYKELEGAGLIRTRRRIGTVVTAIAQADDVVQSLAESFAAQARRSSLSELEAIDLVRAAFLRTAPAAE